MSSIDIGKLSMSFQESFIGSRDQCHVWILLIPDPRDLQKLIGEYETRFCYDDPLVTYDESIDPETFDENRRPGILVGRMSHHSGPEENFATISTGWFSCTRERPPAGELLNSTKCAIGLSTSSCLRLMVSRRDANTTAVSF